MPGIWARRKFQHRLRADYQLNKDKRNPIGFLFFNLVSGLWQMFTGQQAPTECLLALQLKFPVFKSSILWDAMRL